MLVVDPDEIVHVVFPALAGVLGVDSPVPKELTTQHVLRRAIAGSR